MKAKTLGWRLMQRHEAMKKHKIPGKAVIAAARKAAVIVWHMLSEEAVLDIGKMVDRKLAKKSGEMSGSAGTVKEAPVGGKEKPVSDRKGQKGVKKPDVVRKKKKVG
jgi:hypothetical protein